MLTHNLLAHPLFPSQVTGGVFELVTEPVQGIKNTPTPDSQPVPQAGGASSAVLPASTLAISTAAAVLMLLLA